ncbi:MAG: homoserine kinase [Ideonella sp.]|nr:homoserine kinase [Ideonella sp.]
MAVYTDVQPEAAQALLTHLGLGPLQSLTPIGAGIENTNYFVRTPEALWVLTLFERLSTTELPFYLQLMRHLADQGLPVPAPAAGPQGDLMHTLCGKPAALVHALQGKDVVAPSLAQIRQAGALSACLHMAAVSTPLRQPNLRGPQWREQAAEVVAPYLQGEQAQLLHQELAHQRQTLASADAQQAPQGPVHADMFRDNVLFDGESLSGVIDFYFAGVDHWVFDLAVTLNDWCVDLNTGHLVPEAAQTLYEGYADARTQAGQPVTAAEWRLLPAMRRMAALRFWLSRLADWHLPRAASLLTPKDPAHLERVLQDCRAQPWRPVF